MYYTGTPYMSPIPNYTGTPRMYLLQISNTLWKIDSIIHICDNFDVKNNELITSFNNTGRQRLIIYIIFNSTRLYVQYMNIDDRLWKSTCSGV